jgi:hypothetical protein
MYSTHPQYAHVYRIFSLVPTASLLTLLCLLSCPSLRAYGDFLMSALSALRQVASAKASVRAFCSNGRKMVGDSFKNATMEPTRLEVLVRQPCCHRVRVLNPLSDRCAFFLGKATIRTRDDIRQGGDDNGPLIIAITSPTRLLYYTTPRLQHVAKHAQRQGPHRAPDSEPG